VHLGDTVLTTVSYRFSHLLDPEFDPLETLSSTQPKALSSTHLRP